MRDTVRVFTFKDWQLAPFTRHYTALYTRVLSNSKQALIIAECNLALLINIMVELPVYF